MTSVVITVPNLLIEIDVCGSVSGWLSNLYVTLLLIKLFY